jgi:hypothetical protein
MGGSSSKETTEKESLAERFMAGVETEIARRMMIQRELRMALNIAKARDNLQIFGSLWLTLVSGVGAAKIAGRVVPGAVGIPIVVGGVLLGNLADLAYGNKLQRVCNEAEYILDNEQARFVPFPQVSTILVHGGAVLMHIQSNSIAHLFTVA